MTKFKLTLFFALIIFSGNYALCQEVKFKELKSDADWQDALQTSAKSGKDIFLDIYASWCGPCKMMDRDVYSVQSVYDFYNANYINLKVDGETPLGRQLASKYELTAYPSMYFINKDQEVIYKLIGFREASIFLETGNNVKTNGKEYQDLLKLYKSGKELTGDQNAKLISLCALFDDKDMQQQLLKTAINAYSDAEILNPQNKAMIINVGGEFDSEIVKKVLNNGTQLISVWGTDDYNKYLTDALNASLFTIISDRDTARLERILSNFLPVYLQNSQLSLVESQELIRKIYYSQVKDWGSYMQVVENHIASSNNSTDVLYKEAYFIIESRILEPFLLDKANEWMKLVTAENPVFEVYFLNAIINAYRKDYDATLKWMNLAESKAVTEEQKNSFEELKKFMQEME